MAVSLISSPATWITIDDLIQWKLSISDLGTPNVDKKTIAYQLVTDTGTPITDVREINPENTLIQPAISFANEFRAHPNIRTNPPLLFSTSVQDAKGILKVKLKYGEIVNTFATGSITGDPPTNESDVINIINSAIYQNNNSLQLTDSFLMTQKSNLNYYNKDTFDWLYVFGAGTVTIKIGATTVATMTGTADKVNCIPIGAMHFPALKVAPSYHVDVSAGSDNYTFYFKNCGFNEYDEPCQIVYLDSLGGYTAMMFQLVEYGINPEKESIDTFRGGGGLTDLGDYLMNGGNSLMNAKGFQEYTFELKHYYTPDVVDQLTRLISSESYYLILKTKYLSGMFKFKMTNNLQVSRDNTRLRVQGVLSNALLNPIGIQ